MPKLLGPQRHNTSPLVWLAAIICAVLAVAVIITGLVIFVGYMIIHPRPPYISVRYAHLDQLSNDQYGQMDTQISLEITAENDNARAHASFDKLRFNLRFHGLLIAELRAEAFDVPKNDTATLSYVIPSSMIPLEENAREELDASLKQDRIAFHLKGDARMRWKVGILGSVKFWTHLSCQLRFIPSNGSSISSDCTSKSG